MRNHLEDRLAVQDVMLQYASTVDEKDYEGYRALFTKDVIVVGMGERDIHGCLLYTSPSPRDLSTSRMPSSA